MPDCKPCLEEKLEAKPAMYVVNGVPMCAECRLKNGPVFQALKTSPKVEAVKSNKKEEKIMRKQQVDATTIDWAKVKQEREAGARIPDLAKKYDCSAFTIYKYTNFGDGKAAPRVMRRKISAVPRSNGKGSIMSPEAIADLKKKRDALNTIIELAEGF